MPPMPVSPPAVDIVRAVGLTKQFGAVRALSDVTLGIRGSSVLALLGENGAGKSTFISLVSGAQSLTAGHVEFGGVRQDALTPLEAARLGVQVVHQEPKLANEATVAQNIFLSDLARLPALALSRRRELNAKADALLERLNLHLELPSVSTRAGDLTAAERQLVAIAKAMAQEARVMFLDEPNSSLTPRETHILWTIVRRLRDTGIAVVVVSHRLRELYDVVDEVAVLRDGRLVGTGPATDITPTEAVRLMAGRATAAGPQRSTRAPEATNEVLRLEHVTTHAIQDVTMGVHAGEVVGLAGLVGSGRTEIGRAICGADRVLAGRMLLRGRPVSFRSPRQALRAGVVMTAEERRRSAFAGHTVRYNAAASIWDRISRGGLVDRNAEHTVADEWIERLAVRGEPSMPVTALSGGNQQKVLIARPLAAKPAIIVLDEPTHGIDVGTKSEISALVRQLAADGVGVVFISSEVEEILDVADRILVVRHGRIVHATDAKDAVDVVAAALGQTLDIADPSNGDPR